MIATKFAQLEQTISEWAGAVRTHCYDNNSWAEMTIDVFMLEEMDDHIFKVSFLPKYNSAQKPCIDHDGTAVRGTGLIHWAAARGWMLSQVDYWLRRKALDLAFVSCSGIIWRVRLYDPRALQGDIPSRRLHVNYDDYLDKQASLQDNLAAFAKYLKQLPPAGGPENPREIDL